MRLGAKQGANSARQHEEVSVDKSGLPNRCLSRYLASNQEDRPALRVEDEQQGAPRSRLRSRGRNSLRLGSFDPVIVSTSGPPGLSPSSARACRKSRGFPFVDAEDVR